MPEPIRYFFPGPTYVLDEIRRELSAEVVPHRSARGKEVYASVAERLKPVFRTASDVYVATGSSTLVMESSLVSLTGGDVLHLVNGAFSERWADIGRSLGRRSDVIGFPWGEPVDPDLVRVALRRKRYEAVTVVHNETSTGVMSPLEEVSRVVREESDSLLLVDAVSSLAAAPLETDGWGLDLVLAGVQKGLAVPPGLTVFAASERALARAERIAHRGYYTDLLRYRDKHREGGPITTPAVSLLFALDRQLGRVLAEGMEPRWERHRRLYEATGRWADETGCVFASSPEGRSWTVSCLRPPAGVDAPAVVRGAAGLGFTISGGYGRWKAGTFRIGHMGEVQETDLSGLFLALCQVIASCRAS